MHLEIEGVERITAGYGADAAWRMVAAVAAIVSGQLAGQERAFRIGDGQLVVLAAGREPRELIELGVRIAEIVDGSQSERGPRVSINVGIAELPQER